MLMYITIALAVVLAILDIIAYRRIVSIKANRFWLIAFACLAIIANIIPLSAPLFMNVLLDINNSEVMMKVSMFVLTLFIILTLCRMTLYIFWLPSKSKKWLYTGISLSVAVFLFLMHSIFVTRTSYEVKNTEIKFKTLPKEFDGYKLAFISDIHVGTMLNAEEELEKIAGLIYDENVDIVLYGGDLVNMHHSELTPSVLEKLSLIHGKEPTLAVLGNHDTGYYVKKNIEHNYTAHKDTLESLVNSAGWKLLRDSTVIIRKGGDSIAVTGIDYTDELLKYKHSFKYTDSYDPDPVYDGLDKEMFNITVSHLPQLWKVFSDGNYSDLTLSGHIHAMQVKFKIFGNYLSPAAVLYKEWSGLYESGNSKLYINDGIGYVGFFARIGTGPEISVITLRRE